MSRLRDNPSFDGVMQVQDETTSAVQRQQPQDNSCEAILEHKSGLFHLPLTILRPSSDQRDIQLKKERLKDQLNNPGEAKCTKLALLNLLSVFEYALQQTDEAKKSIQDILETDPQNLNALQNLAHINRELGMEGKAKTLEANIARLHGNENTTAEPGVKARVARSMAEQAFALTYDYFEKDENDEGTEQVGKYKMADLLYQSAIEIGNGVVDAEERMTWSFFKAFNHQQIYAQHTQLCADSAKQMVIEHMGKSIASYKEVLEQAPTRLYKAQTLVYLNCVLTKTRADHYTRDMWQDISRFEDEVKTLLQREGSIRHAIDLARNNHRVLNTMARALKYQKVLKEADETVNASLETESDAKINWYGYHLRGELTLMNYMGNRVRPQRKRDPNYIQLLRDSIEDLETCLQGMHSSKNYYLLGKATMKLAEEEKVGATPRDGSSERMIETALTYFNKALKLDQGSRDVKIHSFRAECLKRLKENKQAVESWKRAVELDRQTTTYYGNIEPLLAMLLDQCREMSDSEGFQPVVAETATYLKLALSKYEAVSDKFIPALIKQFPEEFLHTANYFRITKDLGMSRRIWNYVDKTILGPLPQEIAERMRRIGEDIEECQEDGANVGVQEPRSKDHEQTANSDQGEEGATGGELLHERLPATEEQREFMPKQVEKAQNTKGFHYDFFVIHSAKDAEWVNYTLLANLEGEHRLKGCIADRDFQLGKYVLDNITAAIKQSAKVLVILTPDLLQSKWCKHEMKEALHAKVEEATESVIPVLLKDCEVPDEIKNITYLDARKHLDWEHLLRDIQK
ncbi:hypothetical protein Bbelb_030100 [Branchiostoma belcheri]|nr:hypothetical protein Bbelb_030100 [Branchiostoma belcheri]